MVDDKFLGHDLHKFYVFPHMALSEAQLISPSFFHRQVKVRLSTKTYETELAVRWQSVQQIRC